MTAYQTDDLSLAAFLTIHGWEPVFEWVGSKCWFKFEETEALLDAVDDYNTGEARVNARRFSHTSADLKRRMFQAQH